MTTLLVSQVWTSPWYTVSCPGLELISLAKTHNWLPTVHLIVICSFFLSPDGSLQKEPKGDLSSQLPGRMTQTHTHTHTSVWCVPVIYPPFPFFSLVLFHCSVWHTDTGMFHWCLSFTALCVYCVLVCVCFDWECLPWSVLLISPVLSKTYLFYFLVCRQGYRLGLLLCIHSPVTPLLCPVKG